MAMDLYMCDTSPPCRSVWMTCKVLNLDVNIKATKPGPQGTRTPEFRKINHHHSIPTIDDDGFVLWESRTIMRYLVDKYGESDELYPKDLHKRACVERLLDYDASTLYPAIGAVCYPSLILDEAPRPSSRPRLDQLLRELDTSPGLWPEDAFLTGPHPTIADLAIACSVSFLEPAGQDFTPYPRLEAWRQRVKALPYYGECSEAFEAFKQYVHTPEWKEAAAAKREAIRAGK